MPARQDRAAKKKQRSKSRPVSESSKSKAALPSKKLLKKPTADLAPKKKDSLRERDGERHVAKGLDRKGTKLDGAPPVVRAKTDKATPASKVDSGKSAPIAAKGTRAVSDDRAGVAKAAAPGTKGLTAKSAGKPP